VAIDLVGEWIAALQSPDGRAAIAEALRPVVAEETRRALDDHSERLEPLAAILGCSTRAAAARLRRDAGLRALGVPMGRGRFVFKRAEVQQYMRTRGGGQ
jgi:hypothetical protein